MSDASGPSRQNLDRALLKGFVWTSGGRWLVQMFTVVVSILVARLLAPQDYGIVSMAGVYFGFVQLIGELGIGIFLIRRRDLDLPVVESIATLSVLAGALLAALSWPAGLVMAHFYREPRVGPVIAVFGLNLLFSSVRQVSNAMLVRDLDFRRSTMLTITEGVTSAAGNLLFAFLGFGYWALVIGNSIGTLMSTLQGFVFRPVHLRSPRLAIRTPGVVRFSVNLLTDRIAWYLYISADLLAIGRYRGSAELGLYSLAMQLAAIPVERVAAGFVQTLLPIASAVAHRKDEAARYFLSTLEIVVFLTFPITLGLAAVSQVLLVGILGPKWAPAAPTLAVLALAANSRIIASVSSQFIIAMGDARFISRRALLAFCTLAPAFVIASFHSIVAVAVVWVLIHPMVLGIPSALHACRLVSLPVARLIAVLAPYAAGAALCAMAALVLVNWAPGGPQQRLAAGISTGAIIYLVYLRAFHAERLLRFTRIVRRQLSSQPVEVTSSDTLRPPPTG